MEAQPVTVKGDFNPHGDMATFLFHAVQNYPPARARAAYAAPPGRHLRKTQVNLETQSAIAKGPLRSPGQHGDFSILRNTQLPTRARARAAYAAPPGKLLT